MQPPRSKIVNQILFCSLIAVLLIVDLPAKAGLVEDCVQEQDWNLTLESCTKLIETGHGTRNGLSMVYQNRGAAFSNLGEHRRAIEDYDEAIRLNPNNILAYKNRGSAYLDLSQYQRAVEEFDEAIRRDPSDYDGYARRGLAHVELGQPYRAIADYERAIKLNPNDILTIDNLGLIYAKLGRTELGLQHRERAMLRWGRTAIKEWQAYMRDAGLYAGPTNGIYDDATRAAFRACAYAKC